MHLIYSSVATAAWSSIACKDSAGLYQFCGPPRRTNPCLACRQHYGTSQSTSETRQCLLKLHIVMHCSEPFIIEHGKRLACWPRLPFDIGAMQRKLMAKDGDKFECNVRTHLLQQLRMRPLQQLQPQPQIHHLHKRCYMVRQGFSTGLLRLIKQDLTDPRRNLACQIFQHLKFLTLVGAQMHCSQYPIHGAYFWMLSRLYQLYFHIAARVCRLTDDHPERCNAISCYR